MLAFIYIKFKANKQFLKKKRLSRITQIWNCQKRRLLRNSLNVNNN